MNKNLGKYNGVLFFDVKMMLIPYRFFLDLQPATRYNSFLQSYAFRHCEKQSLCNGITREYV